MRYLALLLLLTLLPAVCGAARRAPAAPPPDRVRDRDVLAALAEVYGEKPRLRGAWSGAEPTVRREVCADSGVQRRERRVAVCSSAAGDVSSGAVDLFVLAPDAGRGGRAGLRSRFTGIPTGNGVRPAPVTLVDLGTDRAAFGVITRRLDRGWTFETTTLYATTDGHLRDVLSWRSAVDNLRTCTPGTDRAGRRCRARRVALACTLQAGPAPADDGTYPLALRVSGERGGERVLGLLPIPHDAWGYRVSARALQTQGCDGEGPG